MKTAAMLAIIIITGSSVLLADTPQKGKNLYKYGNSAAALGRAGTGVASAGTDLFYLNPASISEAERLGLGLQYGSLPFPENYYNPEISIALPTSYGTAGFSYRHFHFPEAAQFKSGSMLSIGGAKEFTERVQLGMAVNMFYGSTDDGGIYYFGTTLGARYKITGPSSGTGFGFFDTSAGIALNAGLPLGKHYKLANFNHLTAGVESGFYKADDFTLGFFADVSAIDGYSSYPVKLGLEAEFHDKYIVRAGGTIPVRGAYEEYGDYTLGTGYKFDSEDFAGSVNYAFNYSRGGNIIHYVGATIEYGKLDRTPPKTEIKPDLKYISPNDSGIQDQVYFTTEVKDDSRIEGWKLQILDERRNVFREFSQTDRDMVDSFSFALFRERLFSRKESLVVPRSIMWDGTDDEGKIVPDGRYTYSFYAWDERGNISDRKEGTVVVDTTPPEVELTLADRFFAPTGDGNKDELVIRHKVKAEPEDEWHAGFMDDSGKIVKSYKWKGQNVPSRLVWDGQTDDGEEASEGLYKYFIESTDKAGNSASSILKNITLTRAEETADITVSHEYFSYVNDENLNLKPFLSKKEGIDFWRVIITDSRDRVVREFTGERDFPSDIKWDGLDEDGNRLKDGDYFLKLEVEFITGITSSSFKKPFVVDSTPPDISVSTSPDLFSPDGDGEDDVLTIKVNYSDRTPIKEWKITIFSSMGEPFKTFSGKGSIPEELLWDGRGDDTQLVESASEYFILVEAVDAAGNRGFSNRDKIDIDVLVVVTERGLLMRISNIHFDFDSAQLKEPSFKVLDRVYDILRRYERYKIEIEGHTDDIGPDEYNLKLSERRAESVKEYLIKKGIDPERLSAVGRGKTVPVYDVSKVTDKKEIYEMRRKNRRVEFILIRTDR